MEELTELYRVKSYLQVVVKKSDVSDERIKEAKKKIEDRFGISKDRIFVNVGPCRQGRVKFKVSIEGDSTEPLLAIVEWFLQLQGNFEIFTKEVGYRRET